jgi:hypothetical protein
MDRNIVYPGAIPLDTDLLTINRNTMIAIGYLLQATIGAGTAVDGLACQPTNPASMAVIVGPGSITTLTTVDPLSYGSLPADSTDPLVKMGINTSSTTLTLAAPTSSGQSVNYLIEAAFSEGDTSPVVLPYFNSANPAQPFAGPGNSGSAQNTMRIERVQIQAKAGAPATTGSQSTPAVDSGWVGLFVVTVGYGQSVITAANIAMLPTAPFIAYKLPTLAPGVSRMASLNASQTWTVPIGVELVRVRLWGGGGSGGAGGGGTGGGGGGGGYAEGYYVVSPGQPVEVIVGSGGTATSGNGNPGSASSFGSLTAASGGGGGGAGSASGAGTGSTSPGTGSGSGFAISGTQGQNGLVFSGGGFIGGMGGGAFGGVPSFAPAGQTGTNLGGIGGNFPGGGGSGGIGTAAGGPGAGGLVVIEY